jgi:hypothetical protein
MTKSVQSDKASERPTSRKSNHKYEHDPNHHQKAAYLRAARAINSLRDLGIESLDIDWIDGNKPDLSLPKVVVVGDQSSGKSSLIESMSKIQVPVSAETCTKCPIEIRLCETGDKWQCNVSLRYKPKVDGEQPKVVQFASTAREDEVEEILRRAQLAILNPDTPDEQVKSDVTHPTQPKLEFSEDTIIVEVTGASMNFTFIDLPGIINLENPVLLFFHSELADKLGATG